MDDLDRELFLVDEIESAFKQSRLYRDVPPPGYCHPYHEHYREAIVSWLDGESFGGHVLRLPVMAVTFAVIDPDAPFDWTPPKVLTLRKERAFATAPYVGRPFVYRWRFAVDDHGRCVASEKTEMAYVAPDYYRNSEEWHRG